MRRVTYILNQRNALIDYTVMAEDCSTYRSQDVMLDRSSYLSVTVRGRFHGTTRKQDPKWLSFLSLWNRVLSLLPRAILLALWIFSRSKDLMTEGATFLGRGEHGVSSMTVTLSAVARHLQQKYPKWKTAMPSASRDYGINTASLDQHHDRFLLRGVPTILKILQGAPDLNAFTAAREFAKIKNTGPFLTQHFIWALVLLSVLQEPGAAALEWKHIKVMVSQQNTMALFRRFLASFRGGSTSKMNEDAAVPEEDEDDDEDEHVFFDIKATQVSLSPNSVGVFLIDVFKRYVQQVQMLRNTVFFCIVGNKTYTVRYEDKDIQALSSFFCFVCNACMHEKMWKNRLP